MIAWKGKQKKGCHNDQAAHFSTLDARIYFSMIILQKVPSSVMNLNM